MQNPPTKFNMEFLLHSLVDAQTLNILNFLKYNQSEQSRPVRTKVPNHQFFNCVPAWYTLLSKAKTSLVLEDDGTWYFRSSGFTKLEEQDIGLFLNWILPNVLCARKKPLRLARVRNLARNSYTSLSYFLRDGKLTMDYDSRVVLSTPTPIKLVGAA